MHADNWRIAVVSAGAGRPRFTSRATEKRARHEGRKEKRAPRPPGASWFSAPPLHCPDGRVRSAMLLQRAPHFQFTRLPAFVSSVPSGFLSRLLFVLDFFWWCFFMTPARPRFSPPPAPFHRYPAPLTSHIKRRLTEYSRETRTTMGVQAAIPLNRQARSTAEKEPAITSSAFSCTSYPAPWRKYSFLHALHRLLPQRQL